MAVSAQAIEAGRALVRLGTEDSEFQRGLKRAEWRLRRFSRDVQALGAGMAGLGAAIVAPLALATRSFVKAGDDLDKMGRRLQVGTSELARLAWMAERSGTSIGSVERSIQRMASTIGDAERGLSSAQIELRRLGMSAEDLAGLSVDEQFRRIGDAIMASGDQIAAARRVFGRAGVNMLPMIEDARELEKRYDALGLAIDSRTGPAAARLADANTDVRTGLQRVSDAIGLSLEPLLLRLASKLMEVLASTRRWIDENQGAIRIAARLGAGLLALGGALVVVGTAGRMMAGAVMAVRLSLLAAGKAATAFAATLTFLMAHPVIFALVAIAAAAGAIYYAFRKTNTAADDLAGTLDRFKTPIEFMSLDEMQKQLKSVQSRMQTLEERARGVFKWEEKRASVLREINRLKQDEADLTEAIAKAEQSRAEKAEKTATAVDSRIAALRLELGGETHEAEMERLAQRHREELDSAVEEGRAEDEIAQLKEAHQLEEARLAQRAVDEEFARRQQYADRIRDLRLEAIEDERERAIQIVAERYEAEIRAARKANQDTILMERAREMEISALRRRFAEEDARQRESIAQRIARLVLGTRYQGLQLREKELGLERKAALAAAKGNRKLLELTEKEFALKLAIMRAQAQQESKTRKTAVVGILSGFAAGLAGRVSPAEDRTARATEKTAENTRKLYEEIRNNPGLLWGT